MKSRLRQFIAFITHHAGNYENLRRVIGWLFLLEATFIAVVVVAGLFILNTALHAYVKQQLIERLQDRVAGVAATIESAVPHEFFDIGPMLEAQYQDEIKRIVRRQGQKEKGEYYFLYNKQGVLLAHGGKPESEGSTFRGYMDENGIPVIQRLESIAMNGRDVLEYKWEKPNDTGVHRKIGYARMLRGSEWWVGSGIYVDEIDKAIGTRNLLYGFAGLFLVLLIGSTLLVFWWILEIGQAMIHRMQALARTTDRERCYFALVLHHMVGELTVPLKRKLTNVEQTVDAATRQTLVEEASAYIDAFDSKCRDLEYDIYPLVARRHGLGTALKYWIEEVTEDRDSPEVDLTIDDLVVRSDAGRECALYLVAQGLFQNVLKHAEASKVRIALTYKEPNVTLTMTDTGKGFNVEATVNQASREQSRFGLPGMIAQVEVYEGSLDIVSSIGQGTTVCVSMPWPKLAEVENVL